MPAVESGSREYKAMLKADRFVGDETQALKTATDFWRDAARVFGSAVILLRGNLDQPKDRRLVRFYDSADQQLNRRSYIFRERIGLDGQSRETTLKFRHPDRFIAVNRDLRGANGKARSKFEEDVKPVFQSLYSFSTTQEIAPDKNLDKIKDIFKLYPGLRDSLTGVNVDEAILPVDNFTARELVIGGASMQLGKRLDVWASCVLVLWYDHHKPSDSPAVAEFSFKYGGNGKRFGVGTVTRAFDVFQTLQNSLREWTDMESKTKTAFVYG